VSYNGMFAFEQGAAETTAKVSDIWVCCIMRFQFICCTKTLWTFTANIRLHTFMTTYMYLKITTAAEFLLTNVTCQPSTFIVWLQQICLELIMPCKTIWTLSTWVWLWNSVAVYTIFMTEKIARVIKTCYRVNTCTVCLPCGLSYECLDFQT